MPSIIKNFLEKSTTLIRSINLKKSSSLQSSQK